MTEVQLLHDLILASAARGPERVALRHADGTVGYGQLAESCESAARGFTHLRLSRGARIGVYLDKRLETVVACFGAAAAGCAFVPINPVLKPEQVGYILRHCNATALVTSPERFDTLKAVAEDCPDLKHVILTDQGDPLLSERLRARLM